MKKIFLMLIISIVALSFTSCKQEEAPKEVIEQEKVGEQEPVIEAEKADVEFKLEDTIFDGSYLINYSSDLESEEMKSLTKELEKMIEEEKEINPTFISKQSMTAEQFLKDTGRTIDTDLPLYNIKITFWITKKNMDLPTIKKSFNVSDDIDIFDGSYRIFIIGSEYGINKDKIMKDLDEIVKRELEKNPNIREHVSLTMADFLEKTGNVYETEEDINKFMLDFGIKQEALKDYAVQNLVDYYRSHAKFIQSQKEINRNQVNEVNSEAELG